jgi:hypothetical protein
MELHELLGRAKTELDIALGYAETALAKAEASEEKITDKFYGNSLFDDDIVKVKEFKTGIEEIICDLKHTIPKITGLMEEL